jgi:ketopantoate reductase
LLSLKIADRLQPIVLSFSKGVGLCAARRSICASSLAQLGMTLPTAEGRGDGIVRQAGVNIRGGNRRGLPAIIRTGTKCLKHRK